MDWYQANERFGLDYAIYVRRSIAIPKMTGQLARQSRNAWCRRNGNHAGRGDIHPKGDLHHAGAERVHRLETEYIIKDERDPGFKRISSGSYGADVPYTKRRRSWAIEGSSAPIRTVWDREARGDFARSSTRNGRFTRKWTIRTCSTTCSMKSWLWPKVTEMWQGTPADMVEIGAARRRAR